MKTLIADDEFICRTLLQEFLKDYGPPHVAANGREAIEAARAALQAEEPYDVICMDIGMPEVDGLTALEKIRLLEKEAGVVDASRAKILMISALSDRHRVITAAKGHCDAFLVKPVDKERLLAELRRLSLIP